MAHEYIGERLKSKSFTLSECMMFANLSKDFNEVHTLSPLESGANFENRINHGVHSLLWSLEVFFQEFKYLPQKIHVRYKQPVYLNEEITLYWNKELNMLYLLGLDGSILVNISLSGRFYKYVKTGVVVPAHSLALDKFETKNIDFEKLTLGLTRTDLYTLDLKFLPVLFPELTRFLGDESLSSIIEISQIIGMHLPGKFSILSHIKMEFIENTSWRNIELMRIDSRAKFIILEINSPKIKASIGAFFRPKPIHINSTNNLDVQDATISIPRGRRVLIIGGSSGIGSIVSKVLALNGADVTVTYHRHKDAAESLKTSLTAQGGMVRLIPLSITEQGIRGNLEKNFESIYYFATPAIKTNYDSFNSKLYQNYYYFYVTIFKKLINFFNLESNKNIFFPSTILLDKQKPGFKEYIMAKAQGENACRNTKPSNNLTIRVLRLKAVQTNNTNYLIPIEFSDPIDEAIRIIKLVELGEFTQ